MGLALRYTQKMKSGRWEYRRDFPASLRDHVPAKSAASGGR